MLLKQDFCQRSVDTKFAGPKHPGLQCLGWGSARGLSQVLSKTENSNWTGRNIGVNLGLGCLHQQLINNAVKKLSKQLKACITAGLNTLNILNGWYCKGKFVTVSDVISITLFYTLVRSWDVKKREVVHYTAHKFQTVQIFRHYWYNYVWLWCEFHNEMWSHSWENEEIL